MNSFEAVEIVWVSVRGEICKKLIPWMREQNIWPEVVAGTRGPNHIAHGYKKADAERIASWLEEQGVENA